jgi:hypothetical protein
MEAGMRSRTRYLTALTLATLAAAACESATGGGPGDNQVRRLVEFELDHLERGFQGTSRGPGSGG